MDQVANIKMQILDNIKYLEFENALNLISVNNLPLSSFIEDLTILFTLFKKRKSLLLAHDLVHLFSLPIDNNDTGIIIESWKKEIYLKIDEALDNDPLILIKEEGYKPLIKFFLKDEVIAKDYLVKFSRLMENLVENPNNEPILKFLAEVYEILLDSGNNSAGKIIISWIRAASNLRESTLTSDSIIRIFKESEGSFAPTVLVKHFFETNYKADSYKANEGILNKFSDFLDEFEPIIYNLPNESTRETLLKLVDGFYSTIASGFESIIYDRMRHQSIDRIRFLGNASADSVVPNLIGNLTLKNPLPIIRSIDFLMEEWSNFPKLTNIDSDSVPDRDNIMEVKPLFWFFIFQSIFQAHFQLTSLRLLKNDTILHRNLVESVRVNLNLFYHLLEYLKTDSDITSQEKKLVEEDLIKYLKKMKDMINFSDDELREIANSSYWIGISRDNLLSKVTEAKSHCINCSYNLPIDAKTCPNCGHGISSTPAEEPPIDFSAIGSFFSSSAAHPPSADTINPSSSVPSPSPSSAPKIRVCPRCGSPISVVENRCINCNYQVGD